MELIDERGSQVKRRTEPKIVVWFSCGAASAVAAKLISVKHSQDEIDFVYCDVMQDEHADNNRFFLEIEEWIGHKIKRLKQRKFTTVDDVFESRKYMSGIAGAPCTLEMKKRIRFEYSHYNDVHVFGMTAEETKRAEDLQFSNPELLFNWILIDMGITKYRCLEILAESGIKLPSMYLLGYDHNNCIGCVKSQSPEYWNNIRKDFPEVFAKRAIQSRRYGARLAKVKGERVFLDELNPLCNEKIKEDLSCGPQCVGYQEEE